METGQIAELRRWAEGLAHDEANRELRAAGRAILLLIEELERVRGAAPRPPRSPQPPPPSEPPDAGEETDDVEPVPAWRRRREEPKPKGWRGLFRLAIGLSILGALVFATLAVGARLAAPSLDAQGPSQNAGIGPALLPSLEFSVGGNQGVLDRVRWNLDGVDVTDRAYSSKGRVVFKGTSLGDGVHRLKASVTGGFPGSRTTKSWRFTVDTAGPSIRLDPPGVLIPSGQPIRIAGTLEPGASLIADGRPVLVAKGVFRSRGARRPKGVVTLVATDPLRNATTRRLWISMQPAHPASPGPRRARHLRRLGRPDAQAGRARPDRPAAASTRSSSTSRRRAGTIGWNAPVPLAHEIGAVKPRHRPRRRRSGTCTRKGVRVIGRLVCFNDPIAGAKPPGRRASATR